MSNSIEWTKDIFYLVGKSLKILEIYFTSKSNLNKNFIDVFFEENNKCKYYGIIKYNEKNIKEKKNYFYYEEDPKIVLNKFIKNNKYFDIIIINLQLVEKLNNILYYSILSIELLNENGILILNNYYKYKNIIDVILLNYKDQINLLYIDTQLIIQKKYIQIVPIINEFNNLLDNYWKISELRFNKTLDKLNELPDFSVKYNTITNDFNHEKIYEIFKNLNIEYLLYKYTSIDSIRKSLIKNLKNFNLSDERFKIVKDIFKTTSLSNYRIYNLILFQSPNYYINDSIIKKNKDEKKLQVHYNLINFINYEKNDDYINLKDIPYEEVLENAKLYSEKYDIFYGNSSYSYPDFSSTYHNMLLQTLLLKYVLKIDGKFRFYLEMNCDFIDDYLTLLRYIFKNIYVYTNSNKINRITFRINCDYFLGINDDLYNKLYHILIDCKKNKKIISLFNINYKIIDIFNYKEMLKNISEKIILLIENNKDILKDTENIKILNNYQKNRSITDLIYFIKN